MVVARSFVRWSGRAHDGVVFLKLSEVWLCISSSLRVDAHHARVTSAPHEVVRLNDSGVEIMHRRAGRHVAAAHHALGTRWDACGHGLCERRSHGCAEGCTGCPGRRDESSATLLTAARIVGRTAWRRLAAGSVLAASSWLVAVVWVLTLVTELFFFGQPLPGIFHFFGLFAPLLSNKLGYFWIGKPGVLCRDRSLMMLPVEYEGYIKASIVSYTVIGIMSCSFLTRRVRDEIDSSE